MEELTVDMVEGLEDTGMLFGSLTAALTRCFLEAGTGGSINGTSFYKWRFMHHGFFCLL